MVFQRDIRSSTDPRSLDQSRSLLEGLSGPVNPALALSSTFRISVSLSPQEHAGLRALAANGQRSLGWVMRHALRELLDRQSAQLSLPFNSGPSETRIGAAADVKQAIERLVKVDWKRIRRRTSGTVHNLHPYPTRFTPGVPAKLIELLSTPGDTILDPFCGSGTTLVEAMRQGRRAVGVDASPIAFLISRAKTTRLSTQDFKAIGAAVAHAASLVLSFCNGPKGCIRDLGSIERAIQAHCSELGISPGASLPEPMALGELARWFAPQAIAEVVFIRIAIDQCPLTQAKDVLTVALSWILGRLSFRKSDTRRARIVRETRPRETLNLWTRRVADSQNLLAREHESLPWPPAEVYEHDARTLDFIKPCSVDLVVTSPPYANLYDYRAFQHLRLLALGLERAPRNQGEAETRAEYRVRIKNESRPRADRGIQEVLQSLKRVLKPAGICTFVVGSGRVRRSEEISSSLTAAAANVGFRTIARMDIHTSSTTGSLRKLRERTREQIIVLQV
jgi:DNA modification methylase